MKRRNGGYIVMNSLCDLVADSIVQYGMDQTSSFSYLVRLNEFIENMDDESKEYILKHKDTIIEKVKDNGNIAILNYDEVRDEFDMIFYYDNLLDTLETKIYTTASELHMELELDAIYEIAAEVIDSEDLKKDIINRIKSHEKKPYEIYEI